MTGDDYDPIRRAFGQDSGARRITRIPDLGITVVGTNEEQEKVLLARAAFVDKYCKERGWDKNSLTIPQLLEVRKQPGWENPE